VVNRERVLAKLDEALERLEQAEDEGDERS
jgi:hypothetical protein